MTNRNILSQYILYIIQNIIIPPDNPDKMLESIFANKNIKINDKIINNLITLKRLYKDIGNKYNNSNMLSQFTNYLLSLWISNKKYTFEKSYPLFFQTFYDTGLQTISLLFDLNTPRTDVIGNYLLDKWLAHIVNMYDFYEFKGELDKELIGHPNKVFAIDNLPNGKLVTQSAKEIIVWNLKNSSIERFLDSKEGYFNSLLILSDGRIVTMHKQYILIWNPENDSIVELKEDKNQVNNISIDFINNEERIISSNRDKTIKFWNPKTNIIENIIQGKYRIENFIIVKNKLLIKSYDNLIDIWDLQTFGNEKQIHYDNINHIFGLPSLIEDRPDMIAIYLIGGRYLSSNFLIQNLDNERIISRFQIGDNIKVFIDRNSGDPYNPLIFGENKRIRIMNITKQGIKDKYYDDNEDTDQNYSAIISINILPNDDILTLSSSDVLKIWNRETGKVKSFIIENSLPFTILYVLSNGSIVYQRKDNVLQIMK